MIKTRLLKFIDKGIGTLAVRCMARSFPAEKPATLRSVLFIRPGGIGDAVLLIPALLAFRERYPGARLTVLAEKRNGAVFGLCPAVDDLLCYDRVGDLLKAVQGNYDAVIDTEQWHRLSAAVARYTQAPLLIGYGTNYRKKLFTHPIAYSQSDYEADSFSNLLAPMGIPVAEQPLPPYLVVPENARKGTESYLHSLSGRPFVVMFPGASISERRWGAVRFKSVAEKLQAINVPVIVVGGRGDMADGEMIIAGCSGLNLAGKTSLAETAAIIDKCSVLLSGDSGILHIGVGLGKPTVSLFGAGIEKKWAPRGENHIVINQHLPCSPCTKFGYTPKCPINAKCMSDITVDAVFDAVLRLLEQTGSLPTEKK